MISFNVGVDTKQLAELAKSMNSKARITENDELITLLTKRGYEILQENNSLVNFKYSTQTGLSGDLGYEIISNTIGKIFDHNDIAPFQEFGTGVVGEGTVPNDILIQAGWIYDAKGHGNSGWWYPTSNEPPAGQPKRFDEKKKQWYAWTKGQVGHNVFGSTIEQLKQEMPTIITNYFKNKK